MGTYDSSVALAKKLITSKGRPADMLRTLPGAPADPAKPWRPGAPSVPVYASAVPMVFLDHHTASQALFGGRTLAPEVTQVALVGAGSIVGLRPQIGDFILDGTRRYQVVEVDTLAPGDADILFTLQLKE